MAKMVRRLDKPVKKSEIKVGVTPTYKYFIDPFAVGGDLQPIPDNPPPGGLVNYTTGFGPQYALNYLTNPSALAVPRKSFNQLMNDITTVLQQYQQWGTPVFITSAQNGGVPFPYPQNAYALYDPGTGPQVYQSLVNSNTALPTDATKWQIVTISGGTTIAGIQSAQYIFGTAGGVANTYTLAVTPALITTNFYLLMHIPSGISNTGPSTLNAGTGVLPLLKPGTQAYSMPQPLTGSELLSGNTYIVYGNSVQAVVLNPSVLLSDAVTPTQLRNMTYTYVVDFGTANNYIANFSPSFALGPESNFWVLIQHDNTGPSTITVNGVPYTIIKSKPTGTTTSASPTTPLTGGELVTGLLANFTWAGGSNVQLMNPNNPTALYAQISLTGVQNIPLAGTLAINFNNIDADPYGIVSLPGIIVPIRGRYKVNLNIAGTTNATATNNFVYFTINGTAVRSMIVPVDSTLGVPTGANGEFEFTLNPGDIVGAQFNNANAASFQLNNTSGIIGANVLQISYVGAA